MWWKKLLEWIASVFKSAVPYDKLPDDQTIPDKEADVIVGTVDDAQPVDLEPGDPADVTPIPDSWDPVAHEDDYADDPDVVITDDPEDGSVYSDPQPGDAPSAPPVVTPPQTGPQD